MKFPVIFRKVSVCLLATIVFTLTFVFYAEHTEGPLNFYFIETFHNILFLMCGLSFAYTIYLGVSAYFHYLRELKRAEILKKINDMIIPEDLLSQTLDFALFTVFLYIVQSYVFGYTIM